MKDLINYWLPVIVWMGGIYWGSSLSILPGPLSSSPWEGVLLRKTMHLVEYAVLAALLWRGLVNAFRAQTTLKQGESNHPPPANPKSRLWAFPVALLIAFLYAISDEWHQSLVPNREARLLDVGLDMVGMAIGLALIRRRSASK